MNTLCLAVDRLHIGYLGPYGNSWIETPEWDRLACQSFLLDQCQIDSPHLDRLYRSYWQGWHAASFEPPQPPPSLPALLEQARVHTALLSDSLDVLRLPLGREFAEQIELEVERATSLAESIEETQLAQSFAQLIDWLQQEPRKPFFAWCHLASLGCAWDAPLDFRARYRDEEDPEPSPSSEVPCRRLPQDYDPDDVLVASHAYAGQVALLDTCLGALCEALEEFGLAEDTLLVLLAPRGISLGEHHRLGLVDEALYSPLTHVPLALRFPDGRGALARSQALVEPADLWATLLEWHGQAVPATPTACSLLPLVTCEAQTLRDRLLAVRDAELTFRTRAWSLRLAEQAELYAKPDDRREMNDVAQRCQELLESLRQAAQDYRQALQGPLPLVAPPLPDELLHGMQ